MPTPIHDTGCYNELCFICRFSTRPVLVFRGICEKNPKIDKYYTPIMINGTVHYVGIIKSNWISFDESLMEWKIYEQGTILATALAEKQTMALGHFTTTVSVVKLLNMK